MLSNSLAFTLLVFVAFATALYGPKSDVIMLTKKDFAQRVYGDESVWIVEFFAPWCGHCRNLAPEYEKLAKEMKGIIKVAAIDCDQEKEMAGAFGVQGFPTIKIFPSKVEPTKDKKGVHKVPVDYQGARTAGGMAQASLQHLASFVEKVTTKNVENFLEGEELAKVLLFTSKKTTTDLYKALSVDFHNRLKLGEVHESEKSVVEKYEVKSFPTLVVVTKEGTKVPYSGKLNHGDLSKFLSSYAKPLEKRGGSSNEQQQEKKQTPPPPPAEPARPVKDQVKTAKDFEDACLKHNRNCFIAFLDPTNAETEELQRQVKVLEELHEKRGKVFSFLWVDGQQDPEFARSFDVPSMFPAMSVYVHKKQMVVPFTGSFSTEDIDEFLERLLAGSTKRAFKLPKVPELKSVASSEKKEL